MDHNKKRIWTYNGRNSPFKLQIYGGILAGMLRKQLKLFYRVYALNMYSTEDPEFQEVMVQSIAPGRAKTIDVRSIKCPFCRMKLTKEEFFSHFCPGFDSIKNGGNDDDDDGDRFPYPYIYKPPDPPDDLALAPRVQLHASPKKKDSEEKTNCQFCGRELTKEEQLTHSCQKKPNNS